METPSQPADTAPVIAIFGEVLADVFPDQSVLGGAPFNVARHLQVFGLRPLMISRIGNDALGEILLQEMVQRRMETTGMQRDAVYPTGQVRVVLEDGGHRFDILPEQAYDAISAEAVTQALAKARPQLAYFGTLALRGAVSRQAALAFLQECWCQVFLDINLRAPWFDVETIDEALHAADLVKLNDEELAIVAELFGFGGLAPEAQALALQQRFGLQQILVTCGVAGSWLLDEQQQVLRAVPAEAVPVADTVGAGDAYAAVFLQGLLAGWDAQTTLQRASDYAAAQCRVRGAAPTV
jgi:fructokinase